MWAQSLLEVRLPIEADWSAALILPWYSTSGSACHTHMEVGLGC